VELGQASQALVAAAAIVISLFTFVMSTNDRRHRDDREELKELQERNERLTRERDDFERRFNEMERKYYAVLEENSTLRRGNL
jgi:hypothetical protein